MSTQEIFATGRVVERLIICGFGGLALTYGWNLFRVGVVNQQSAELAAKGWRVNLKRVGPGIFFALFGSAVLAVSLRSPLNLPIAPGPNSTVTTSAVADGEKSPVPKESEEVRYNIGNDPRIARGWVASLNTVLHVATPDKFQAAVEKKAIGRAEDDLEALRNTLVIGQFGPSLFREYKAYRKRMIEESAQATQQEQQKFAHIDEWMQANRIQE